MRMVTELKVLLRTLTAGVALGALAVSGAVAQNSTGLGVEGNGSADQADQMQLLMQLQLTRELRRREVELQREVLEGKQLELDILKLDQEIRCAQDPDVEGCRGPQSIRRDESGRAVATFNPLTGELLSEDEQFALDLSQPMSAAVQAGLGNGAQEQTSEDASPEDLIRELLAESSRGLQAPTAPTAGLQDVLGGLFAGSSEQTVAFNPGDISSPFNPQPGFAPAAPGLPFGQADGTAIPANPFGAPPATTANPQAGGGFSDLPPPPPPPSDLADLSDGGGAAAADGGAGSSIIPAGLELPPPPEPVIPPPVVTQVKGTRTLAATLLLPNGARVTAFEGDNIGNGITLTAIRPTSVLAVDKEGEEFMIGFGSSILLEDDDEGDDAGGFGAIDIMAP